MEWNICCCRLQTCTHMVTNSSRAERLSWRRFVDTILRLREDMRIAYASTALLIIGFGFKFLGGPALAVSACVGSVVALSGIPNLVQTVRTLLDGKSNVDVLMTMAALASMLSGARLEGALLLVLYTLSHAAEHNITDRAKGDLDAIKDLSPETAYRLNSANGVVQVPVGEVRICTFKADSDAIQMVLNAYSGLFSDLF